MGLWAVAMMLCDCRIDATGKKYDAEIHDGGWTNLWLLCSASSTWLLLRDANSLIILSERIIDLIVLLSEQAFDTRRQVA